MPRSITGPVPRPSGVCRAPLVLLCSLLCAPPVAASTDSELLRSRALFAMGGEEYAAALGDLERAVASDPEDRLSHYYHAVVLARLGRYPEALTAFERAGEAAPAAAFERGLVLYRLGRYPEALSALQTAVEREPERADAHYYLGLTLLRLERPADAIEPLEEAMALREELAPSAIYLRAGAHAAVGEVSHARRLLHQGVKAYPQSVYAGAMLDRIAALEGVADTSRAWQPMVSLGLASDSNVGLFADAAPLPASIDSGSDSRVELNAGADYLAHRAEGEQLTLGYHLFASKHGSLSDYDLLRHELSGAWLARAGFGSWGVNLRLHATSLGGENYSSSVTLAPSLVLSHAQRRHSLVRLELTTTTYADDGLAALDGSRQLLSYRYILPQEGHDHWYLGAELGREDTDDPLFDATLFGLSGGLSQQLSFADLRLGIDYQKRDYAETTPTREDETRQLSLSLVRSLSPTLTLTGSLMSIDHPSNWLSYDYSRNLFSVTVRWQP